MSRRVGKDDTKKKILLVEPKKGRKYHTPYPPLGLLKLATYHKNKGDVVRLVQGSLPIRFGPDWIYITSLFTYAYEPVHDVIQYYSLRYKKARIIVGGIYATLCPEHLRETFKDRIEIHQGLMGEAEDCLPDYSLIPSWNTSILFSSRGCVRKCPFCSVPKIEPEFRPKESIKHLIHPNHKKAILWDNNILASPYLNDILGEIKELDLEVDFNQGLDARLLTEDIAEELGNLKMPVARLAYDSDGIKVHLERAINLLKSTGIRGRDIIVYCLYNHLDTPDDFLDRTKDLIDWGVTSYPMRYEPLEPMPKNTYVSNQWNAEQLEMVADARRVMGYGGAFPPYEGLRRKFINAKNFEEAFKLRPVKAV